jgi:rubrerythrin
MADPPRRPTLHLKLAPRLAAAAESPAAAPLASAQPATASAPTWKCKPCGATVPVGADLDDEAVVRCPSCNARLGLAQDFRQDPPGPKLRARRVGDA